MRRMDERKILLYQDEESRPVKARALLFAPFCYPLAGAEAIATAKLVIAFINAGLEIDVITQADASRYYPDACGSFWSRLRHALHPVQAVSGARRLAPLVWAVRAALRARLLMARARYDVVLSRATPQYGHLPPLLLPGLRRIPWVANWSDPLPPAKAPPPYGRGPEAKLDPVTRGFFGRVCRIADWHTFPAERLRSYFLRYQSSLGTKSSIVPHVAVRGIVAEVPRPGDLFTISCTGSLTHRDPRPFLEAFRQFLEMPAVSGAARVTFIGPAPGEVRELVAAMALGRQVNTQDAVSYENVLAQTAAAHAALVIEIQEGEGIFLPSKVADIVQTGTPILALSPRIGTVPDLLQHSGGGIAVDGSSVEDICSALVRLHQAWRDGSLVAVYGSERLLPLFGEETVVEGYRRIFKTIGVDTAFSSQLGARQ